MFSPMLAAIALWFSAFLVIFLAGAVLLHFLVERRVALNFMGSACLLAAGMFAEGTWLGAALMASAAISLVNAFRLMAAPD